MSDAPRPPAVAGQFYPADGQALARAVEECFTDPRGPGRLPGPRRETDRHIRAIVAPHAGYPYSGPVAAWAFARIAAERPPKSVLVLGVDHQGVSSGAALSRRAWKTPLGPTQVDTDLVDRLAHDPITVDEAAHVAEHSIEVELPFLEYVLPKPKFAALMVRFGSLSFLRSVAEVVRGAVTGEDVLLIASTDFSHYVSPEQAKLLDHHALAPIVERRPTELYETVARERISMCGIAPTTVMLEALSREPLTGELLKWGHSGEAQPMREVVGYAALAFASQNAL